MAGARPQRSGDLRDRKPLGLAKVARESNRPVAFVHTVISWRRSIGRHVSSIANVDVVAAADVAGFRTYRDSDAGTGSTRRDRVSRTGRPRHIRGRSVAGREARPPPLTRRPTRQAQIDELRPAYHAEHRRRPGPACSCHGDTGCARFGGRCWFVALFATSSRPRGTIASVSALA